MTNPSAQRYFGWGETLNDVRVVEYTQSPQPPTPPKPEGFKVGDKVVPTKLVDYDGRPLKQYDSSYTITQISGDRAVLSARGAVWAAMNTKNIKKA